MFPKKPVEATSSNKDPFCGFPERVTTGNGKRLIKKGGCTAFVRIEIPEIFPAEKNGLWGIGRTEEGAGTRNIPPEIVGEKKCRIDAPAEHIQTPRSPGKIIEGKISCSPGLMPDYGKPEHITASRRISSSYAAYSIVRRHGTI
jgi:hypothetical protein